MSENLQIDKGKVDGMSAEQWIENLEKEIAELKRQLEEWQFPKWGH